MIRVRSHLNRWLTSLVLFSLVLGPLSVPAQVSASQRTTTPAVEELALSLSDLAITAGNDPVSLPDQIDVAPVVQPDAGIVVSVVVEPSQLPADGESQAVVLIYVTDADGLPVHDGTPITVKTTAGRLSAEEGKTEGGLLRLTLTAPDKPAEGTITAFAGEAKGEAAFTAGGAAVTDGGVVPGAVAEAAQRARNRLQRDENGRWTAQNKRYAATFDETGLALNLKQDDADEKARLDAAGGVRLSYRLEEVTLGGETLYRQGDRANAPRIADNAARYERASILEEGYTARDRGVQQTFTLWEPLPGVEGDLVIRGFLDTPLEAELLSREEGVLFYLPNRQDDSTGERAGQERASPVLRYTGALVRDAAGREIWADLALDRNRLTLSVPGAWLAEAAYPVVIDPMIGDPTLVSDPRDMQDELDVAYNGSGDEYLVVWGGYDTGGADVDIEAQRVDADGTLLGDLIVIAQATDDQIWPAVAYDSDLDEYLVVWTDYRDDVDGDVYGQRVDADGTLLGSVLLIGDTETLQDRPDVAYNAADEVYLAVWRDRRGSYVYVYGQVISSGGVLSGTNLIVYNGDGDNYDPRVAYNGSAGAAGEFLVVWSRWWEDIYGQRLSGLGALLDNSGTPEDESDPAVAFIVSDSGVDQCYPAVAANDVNGNYLVVWADSRNDSGDIYGRLVSAAGALVGADFAIAANVSDYQSHPDLAYDGVNDVYLAVWRDDSGSDQDSYGQIISAAGTLSGTNFVIDDSTGTQYYPEAAANTAAGGFLSAWRDWRNDTSNVYGRLVAASGQAQGTTFAIGPVTGGKYNVDLAYNGGAGEYLVVWEDYRNGDADIYGQRLDQDGIPVGDNFRISDASTADQLGPRVTSAGAAGYLVVWEDRRNDANGDIYGQRVAVDGTLLGNNVLVAATGEKQSEVRLAYNLDDAAYLVVWQDMRADGYGDIYGQMISSGGVLSGSNFVVSAYGGRSQEDPAVVYNDSSSEFLVTWSHWQLNGNYDIYAQRLSGGGVLLDNSGTPGDESQVDVSFAVCTASGSQYEPQVAVAVSGGTYLVVWYDRRNYATNNEDLYGQMIAPDGALSGGNIALSTASGRQRIPMIAALPGEAGFALVWNDMRSGYDLYGQRVSIAGVPVGQAERLADEVSWLDSLSLAAHAARPEAMVTWEESGNIYAQRYSVLMADFSAAPRFGSAPLTVTFTNTSTYATSYEWDLGDGVTSTLESPTHIYTVVGTYTVTLSATGPSGTDTKVRTAYVTVTEPSQSPVADFSATPLYGTAPLTMTFTNLSANATSYEWDLGDGMTSTLESPTYTYTVAGVYTVTLTATGPGGSDTEIKTDYITVTEPSQSPVADFSATPLYGNEPLTVTFTNLSVNATGYEWDFGDGVTSTIEHPTHVYTQTGLYTVTLTAIGPGGSDTETKAGYIVVGGQTEAVIDPENGGTLSSVDGRVRLDFPPGAVTESMTVTMFISETNVYTVGQTAPLVLFSLEAEGHPDVEFAAPVTVTLTLSLNFAH